MWSKIKDNPGETKKFVCGFCKNKFEGWVRRAEGGKHSSCSNQVQCPNCKNFLVAEK
jgi:hypothetical protein